MEIANIPVPIAAISYQKYIFCNCDKTCRSYYSNNTVRHVCGTDYVCYNEISLQCRQQKLINPYPANVENMVSS